MKIQHPDHSGRPIEIADDQLANYESQGWSEVKPKPKSDD